MGDEVDALPAVDLAELDVSAAEPRNVALVRLGALLAMNSSTSALQRAAQDAEMAGVSPDEMVRCVVAIASTLGIGRVSSIAPRLALALGFDLNRSLEELTTDR